MLRPRYQTRVGLSEARNIPGAQTVPESGVAPISLTHNG